MKNNDKAAFVRKEPTLGPQAPETQDEPLHAGFELAGSPPYRPATRETAMAVSFEDLLRFLAMVYGLETLDEETVKKLEPFSVLDGSPLPGSKDDSLVLICKEGSGQPLTVSHDRVETEAGFIVDAKTAEDKERNLATMKAVMEAAVLASANPGMMKDGMTLEGSAEMQILLYFAAVEHGLPVDKPANIPQRLYERLEDEWAMFRGVDVFGAPPVEKPPEETPRTPKKRPVAAATRDNAPPFMPHFALGM